MPALPCFRNSTPRVGFFGALRSRGGVVDLASVMVGVMLSALLATAATVAVVAVVPWANNDTAVQTIEAVRAAERGTSIRDGVFKDKAALLAEGRLAPLPNVAVGVGASGSCYVIASKSATGTTFYGTSNDGGVIVDDSEGPVNTSWCVTLAPIGGA
jgi:hypothetical protein